MLGADVPNVRLLGYVDDALLPGLYAGASAFLYPSLYEGFGLPPLEALAAGTPVVTSRDTVMAEIAGPAALLVDPHDAGSIADGLVEVLRGPTAAPSRPGGPPGWSGRAASHGTVAPRASAAPCGRQRRRSRQALRSA